MDEQRKPGCGVVVGKFQVPDLHPGHHHLLNHANRHQRLLVFIGCHPAGITREHPLDFATRERMIKAAFPNALVYPLLDLPDDGVWSEQLNHAIRIFHPHGEVTLYGSRDSFKPHYEGSFPVKEIEQVGHFAGREIRDNEAYVVGDTPDFRKGVIYSTYNVYPRVSLTVDIAVIKTTYKRIEVLLGSKKSKPGALRFPGGFVNPSDVSTDAAARRELYEETGLAIEGDLTFLGNLKVQDWRDVGQNRFFTNFYLGEYTSGILAANDDLFDLRWVPFEQLLNTNFADGHRSLCDLLLRYWTVENRQVAQL